MKSIVRIMAERMKGGEISIHKYLKNNSVELHGISIMNSDTNMRPNIYLESYYEKYKEGVSVEDIADEIIEVYNQCEQNSDVIDINEFNFDTIQDRITFRLVSKEKNKKVLEEIPYIEFLDMAIIFYVLVNQDSYGVGSVRINNDMIREWGINHVTLMHLAGENTPRLFPAKFVDLMELVKELDGMSNNELELHKSSQVFVLTNEIGINGSGCILYKNILKEIADKMKSNIYILPSSIHEVLILPYEQGLSYEKITNMITQVNYTVVNYEDILTDHPYIYIRKTGKIEYKK